MTAIPPGWEETTLGSVADTRLGKMLSRKAKVGAAPRPYLRNRSVQWGRIDLDDLPTMDFDPDELERFEVLRGDLLVCEGGEVGRAAIWRGQLDWVGYQKALHRVRPLAGIAPEFVLYCFMWLAQSHALEKHVTGSTIKHLPQEDLREIAVPVPPLNEQRRIVAAIEEQLSRLDAADTSLAAALRRLDGLRQGTIAAEVAGGWPLRQIGELGNGTRHALAIGPFGSNLKVSDYSETGVPLIFVRDIRTGEFGGPRTRFVSELKAADLSAHTVRSGDLLVTKMGDPPGDAAVYPFDRPAAILTADCIKVTPREGVDARFVSLTFVLPEVRRQIAGITKGVAQKKVSLARFKTVAVPVPPLEEQRRIVARVEKQLSAIEALRTGIERAQRRSATLRRAVLERAFKGKLVPQDPRDEPAETLLARIRAERSVAALGSRPLDGLVS